MRPYLAILRDSFHEALASRVLWTLLILTTITLLALLPLGVTEEAGSFLNDTDIVNPASLLRKLAAGKEPAATPESHIWSLLGEDLQKRILEKPTGDGGRGRQFGVANSLRDQLNTLFDRTDFYNAPSWAKAKLGYEAGILLEQGIESLPPDQLARFNRLALQAAFPDEVAAIRHKQIQLAYFNWELGLPLPLRREQLQPAIHRVVLALMVYLLGIGGVLIAILVTASLIPHTFEAGAIDLLLSKPISRVGLFLTKFGGGCAFIALNASYFIVGLWLILGVRFGVWNQRLLWCIPVYLFLFAIYYSVSALTGVLWRNAIISVVMTIVFWAVCWGVGLAKGVVEMLALAPKRINKIIPTDAVPLAVNEQGDILQWQDSDHVWQPVFFSSGDNQPRMPFFSNQLVGPIYDAKGDRLLAVDMPSRRFGMFSGSSRLLVGKRDDHWKRVETVAAPEGAVALFTTGTGEILAVSPRGIFHEQGELAARPPQISIFGLQVPMPETGGRFVEAGPKLQLSAPLSAAMSPDGQAIALYDGDKLQLFRRGSEAFAAAGEVVVGEDQPGLLAVSDNHILLALGTGALQIYAISSGSDKALQLEQTLEPEGGNAPRYALASADGKYLAVLFHNQRLWLYDVENSRRVDESIAGQGDLSAAAFTAEGQLLVADHLTRIRKYTLAQGELVETWQPRMELAETIYRYLLEPIYTVFPKPGQLDQTNSYLLTEEESMPLRGQQQLSDARRKLDVWGPVWSNLAFLIVMLGLASWYTYRKDF